MTALDPDAPVDPVVCINIRMAGGRPECGEPESAHCDGCRFCPGNCTCRNNTPADKHWLAAALDAFAQNGSHPNWQALSDTVSHSCAEAYRSDIAAAITPLVAEIHRLTAEVKNLKHSKETS